MLKKNYQEIRISTRRLELRAFVRADLDSWNKSFQARLEPKSIYDEGPPAKKKTKKEFEARVKRYANLAKKDEIYIFGAFCKRTGAHIGSIDLLTIQRRNMNWANIGYFIHNQYQGKHYGAEMLKAALKLAHRDLSYKRVEAAINLDNEASLALAKSIGMLTEGVRKNFIFERGRWVDHHIFVSIR